MKINYKNNEYTLKYGIRAMIMFENATNSTLTEFNLESVITLFYCVFITSIKDYSISFDEFIDYLDDNPNLIKEFTEYITSIHNNNNVLKKD